MGLACLDDTLKVALHVDAAEETLQRWNHRRAAASWGRIAYVTCAKNSVKVFLPGHIMQSRKLVIRGLDVSQQLDKMRWNQENLVNRISANTEGTWQSGWCAEYVKGLVGQQGGHGAGPRALRQDARHGRRRGGCGRRFGRRVGVDGAVRTQVAGGNAAGPGRRRTRHSRRSGPGVRCWRRQARRRKRAVDVQTSFISCIRRN